MLNIIFGFVIKLSQKFYNFFVNC